MYRSLPCKHSVALQDLSIYKNIFAGEIVASDWCTFNIGISVDNLLNALDCPLDIRAERHN